MDPLMLFEDQAQAHDRAAGSRGRGPTVVGLDLSLRATGIASSDGWCHVTGHQEKRRPITKLPAVERVAAMRRVLASVLALVGAPDLLVVEAPALSRSGGGAHERGWLWWSAYASLADAGVPVALVSTNQLKQYATGSGRADKTGVVDAVARRWPAWQTAGDDNAADAVVLMAAGRDRLGWPLARVPKTHRSALDKATWPSGVGA